jgi:hypothetical protein
MDCNNKEKVMDMKKAVACMAAGWMVLGTSSQVLAAGCPFAGVFDPMSPGESVVDSVDFQNKSVEFVAFVGDASLDLVGLAITDVQGGAIFNREGSADCTARPPVSIAGAGFDDRFDDAVIRCGFLSVPDSLQFAIGIVNIDDEQIPDECRN